MRNEPVRIKGIPELAYALRPVLIREIRYWWGVDTQQTIFFAQVHQESTWRPDAKSAYASGLAQFTPDTAKWISQLYPKDLGENNPLDTKWALRALVKYDKWIFDKTVFADKNSDRWCFSLSGYNGGYGWVAKDRALAETAGRDSSKWVCNTEHFSNRSAGAIKENRDYVTKITTKLLTLYQSGGF